ncbi:hypothetical protein DXG03_002187 [Asterophora parasitica]|uniref:Uncharacterized protein n=1 Tax=Asterophora parasitica TaxID=117018 RepID=A0A9P7GGA8_9AGAR|nr:hypothetical protein DXG03_002187 [Asterophora parasitica]
MDQPTGRTLSSPPQTSSSNRLRYDAYDAPVPRLKLRTRDSSRSSYTRSERLSDSGHDTLSRVDSRLSMSSVDSLSRTMTPGELTLAASRQELEKMTKAQTSQIAPRLVVSEPTILEELGSRVDLIALDSPFVSDPVEFGIGADSNNDKDFKALWESIMDGDARGWYDGAVDTAIRRIQDTGDLRLETISANVPPFAGKQGLVSVPSSSGAQ